MILLLFYQGELRHEIGLFEEVDQMMDFLKQIPGFQMDMDSEITINPNALPDYIEIPHRGNLVPLTKFSFTDEDEIYVDWLELNNLSQEGDGLVDGYTKVDAYYVENSDLKEYISTRESKYEHVKALIEAQGFVVERGFEGSEDGEAIIYRRPDSEDWHFLTHMDSDFVEREISDQEFLEYLD